MRCLVCGDASDGGLQCGACRAGLPRRAPDPAPLDAPRADGSRRVTHDPARADVLEATEQEAIRQALLARGWRVWRVGQRDARGTQDPGVPDLYALHRRHGALWIECKRPHHGVQSSDQRDFQAACEAAGVRYVVGALPHVRAALDAMDHPHLPRTA